MASLPVVLPATSSIAAANGSRTRLREFTELWFHTGTACNLECPFCLEGSKPADTRLERMKLIDAQPFMEEAVRLGVQRFAFTGGEPLIVKDIVKILEYALSLRPCLVLTNGTAPLLKRVHQLELLQKQKHPLSFRVSIDYPSEEQHDAGRGWGNFRRALEGLKLLYARGFPVSVARQLRDQEDTAQIQHRYGELFKKHGLPGETPVIALPDFGTPNTIGEIPPVNTGMVDLEHANLMCTHSRMIVKKHGEMRVYACPFVDDDDNFDIGATLTSARSEVCLQHHRCLTCVKFRATYSESSVDAATRSRADS